MAYRPQPIATDDIVLSDELLRLTEVLARNAHDRWAEQRLSEGWRVGPARDDAGRRHPGLVAYDELPESEREYDRVTVLETIRALLALGWRLDPPAPTDPSSGKDATVERLVGERLLRQGDPILAADVLATALDRSAGDVRLRQLHALALARAGATERANSLLAALEREGQGDEETLGLLARTHKDLAARAADAEGRRVHLRWAYELYRRAHETAGGYWSGINAAALALVLGASDVARALAGAVDVTCRRRLTEEGLPGEERYWLLSALGEGALIRGSLGEAEMWYGHARAAVGGRFGDLASTRRNARLIADALRMDGAFVDRCLPVPRVAVFLGVWEGSDVGPQLQVAARQALAERLAQMDVRIGFATAASGAGVAFLEALLAAGGAASVVLAHDDEAADHRDLLARATEVIVANPGPTTPRVPWSPYAARMLVGLAILRAQQLETELVPIVLSSGGCADEMGVGSLVRPWRDRGRAVEVVQLPTPPDDSSPPPLVPEVNTEPPVRAVLFADAVHFSALDEEQVARFVTHFLGVVSGVMEDAAERPLLADTWGDGLFMVFERVGAAAAFALDLVDAVAQTDWAGYRLPADLSLRVGLHAGPIHEFQDPVTRRRNWFGLHVNRGARIEPITPPGQVYASQAFAALAVADGVPGAVCEYVGRTAWAKNYGTHATYHLRRGRAADV